MTIDREKLLELIEEDDLGLLKIRPKQSNAMSEDERLAESFFEIVDFYKKNGREPDTDFDNVQEYQLASRLDNLRNDKDKILKLMDLDEFGLLQQRKKVESLADVLADDSMNLLGRDDGADIFRLVNVPRAITMPEYIAQRKPCPVFAKYEFLFKKCHSDLQSGKRKLYPFANEQQIVKGQFFILRGVMAYIADVGEKKRQGGRVNARLHCIFENGTESDMLLRSLACELYKDGRRISEHTENMLYASNNVAKEDSQTGYIYVLKSLSRNPDVAKIADLYKIGFSSVPVEERIKNADNDPTFLCAPVKIIETYTCYNLNPQKMELILHKFFGRVCLNIDVFDKDGKRYTPREWFIAPLYIIEEAIRLLLSGEIINVYYDPEHLIILEK